MTLSERVECLRATPLFAGLDQPSLERIARLMSAVEAPPGHVLVEPNTPGSGMFVIEEGTVTVERRGRRSELGPGDVFGELALLSPNARRTARVQAKTAVRCLAISRPDFREMLLAEPSVAVGILEIAAERLIPAEP